MRSIFITLAALTAINTFSAENKKDILRLDVYPIAGMTPMPVHSIVTNISDMPVTVPTRSYSDRPDGRAEGGSNYGIIFSIGFGSVGEYKLVPSPLRFFPVTLQPGESTELTLVLVTLSEEKTVEVVFAVDEDYARRNGWWFGRLKKKVVIGEGPNPYIVEAFTPPLVAHPPKEKQPAQTPKPMPDSVVHH